MRRKNRTKVAHKTRAQDLRSTTPPYRVAGFFYGDDWSVSVPVVDFSQILSVTFEVLCDPKQRAFVHHQTACSVRRANTSKAHRARAKKRQVRE